MQTMDQLQTYTITDQLGCHCKTRIIDLVSKYTASLGSSCARVLSYCKFGVQSPFGTLDVVTHCTFKTTIEGVFRSLRGVLF